MNQLTELLGEMQNVKIPDKTTFGAYNYLTPPPRHTHRPRKTIEKLAVRLKYAADRAENIPKLVKVLEIIAESLKSK
jgi:hypothetical protein